MNAKRLANKLEKFVAKNYFELLHSEREKIIRVVSIMKNFENEKISVVNQKKHNVKESKLSLGKETIADISVNLYNPYESDWSITTCNC
jgi:hypothetical protein